MNPLKTIVQKSLGQFGYQIQRKSNVLPSGGGFDTSCPLPEDASTELRPDHPRLLDLDRRYKAYDSPVCKHTLWAGAAKGSNDNHLRYFRGDNMYMWAYRSMGDTRRRFYVYGDYIRGLDTRGLMGNQLTEDGAFGCFNYRFESLPTVSRDLMDSVNELYFLDRHCQLFSTKGLRVLDIGAGYGRLAHRMLEATPNVERYVCIDAVPRSTFLCDYYLRHRGLAGKSDSRALIVPLDQQESIKPGSIDLAINVHSFSEMCYDAIEAWVQWLVRLQVPRLFTIPNQPQLLTTEVEGDRREFNSIFERAGFRRVAHEPTLTNPDVRELVGVRDFFWLFERT